MKPISRLKILMGTWKGIILKAHGPAKLSVIQCFSPCQSMRAGFLMATPACWRLNVAKSQTSICSLKKRCSLQNGTWKMNNKKVILNPILRIWLAIFAIIIFISVLSAFNGERWHFNKTVDYFKAATGDVTTHELYTPAKIFFALIFSFAPPLLWLLVVNKRKLMAVTHGVIPLVFFLLSIFFLSQTGSYSRWGNDNLPLWSA